MFLVNAMVSYLRDNHGLAFAGSWLSRVLVRLMLLRDYDYITDALNVLYYILVRVVIPKRNGVIGKSIGKPLCVYFGIIRWVDGDFVVSLLVGEDEKPELISFELRQLR